MIKVINNKKLSIVKVVNNIDIKINTKIKIQIIYFTIVKVPAARPWNPPQGVDEDMFWVAGTAESSQEGDPTSYC